MQNRIPIKVLCLVSFFSFCGTLAFTSYFEPFRAASFFVFLSFTGTVLAFSVIKPERSIQTVSSILGLFSSATIIFGYSYDRLNSYSLIFKNLSSLSVSFACFIFLSAFIFCLVSILISFFLRQTSSISYCSTSKENPRLWGLLFFLIILVGSIPYLLLYCPGLNIFDTHDQILQYFGYPSYIGDGSALTDHHPVLLTVIYGLFIRLGISLGNASMGQLLYSIISMTAISLCFAVALIHLCEYGMTVQIGLAISVFISLWPVTATYAFNMCKDVTVAPFILLFSIHMIDLYHTDGACFLRKTYNISFVICTLIILMMRKSAFAAIILTGILFVLTYKHVRAQIMISFGIIVSAFVAYQSFFLPAMHVIPGESREMFSIPFQQTARYLIQYPEDVTPSEMEKLSRVINLDSIPNYDPRLSDPIKDTSVPSANSDDYIQYFKAWFSMGIRHPGVYLDAWLNMIYGYFYPSESNTILCLTLNSPDTANISLNQNPSLNDMRLGYYNFVYYTLRRLPIIGCLFFVPIVTWSFILLLSILFIKHGTTGLIPWTFFIATLGISLFSPKSGEIRYILPILYALPIMFGLITIRKDHNNL